MQIKKREIKYIIAYVIGIIYLIFRSEAINLNFEEQTTQDNQFKNQSITLINNQHFRLTDNKQGLLNITYKSDKYGVILIQNTSKENSKEYKYILEPGEFNIIALTDGVGTYNLKLHNVEESGQGIAKIIDTYENITIELSEDFEYQVFKNSTTLVDFENNLNIIDEIFQYTNDIDEIYIYFKNMGYDYTLANKISSGEITKHKVDINKTLREQRGICYDIATSMTAVLRSKGYTTQMVYGYINNTYHSWVRVLIDEHWVSYDPTLGKTSYNDDMSSYIIDEYH